MLTVLQVRTLQGTWIYPACALVALALTGIVGLMWLRLRAIRFACERERRGREEMETYARLDLSAAHDGNLAAIAGRVCGVIAARSSFSRVAMLTAGADGSLYVAATQGMDAATKTALEQWLPRPQADAGETAAEIGGVPLGCWSRVVRLGEGADRRVNRAIFVPITTDERQVGALVVCADSIFQVQRRMAEEAVAGLEALSLKIAREVARIAPEPQKIAPVQPEGELVYLRSDPFRIMLETLAGTLEDPRISPQKI
ncbi:hypothetical protein JAO29_16405 [Edaphobacter sp. HDX4]|uniref:hypothetical protein n=1 Tax=Edaphobacter sp. HDX4 TaxID=2794064 RepID=UPI002FE602F4